MSAPRGVALSLALFATLTLPSGCRPASLRPLFDGMHERVEWVMGTRLRIAIQSKNERRAPAVLDEAFAAARALDALLSDYQASSPLSRLNAAAGGPATKVDPRLLAFLRRSQGDTRRTDGLFDITVGALVWGYRKGLIVDDHTLAEARARTGPAMVEIDAQDRVRLAKPGVRLDPGGIGKGYAVDAIVAVLRARGIARAYVDFGGSSVFGLGAPRGRRGWPVLIPGATPDAPIGILWLRDDGFSASEALPPPDLQKSKRRGHIVDPRTGQLVEKTRFALCVSVSGIDAEVVTKPLVIAPELLPNIPARYPGALGLVHEAGQPPRMNEALRARFTPVEANPTLGN